MVNNKKTVVPYKRNKFGKSVRKSNKQMKFDPMAAHEEEEDHKMGFLFLGFPNKEFKYKSKGPILPSAKSDGAIKHMKTPLDEEDDDDGHFKLPPLLFPPALLGGHKAREEATDDYCTEIVDQLRQNNNSLIDELKEMRKEVKESSESTNKEMINAIKELQSELKKTLAEELPKLMKK